MCCRRMAERERLRSLVRAWPWPLPVEDRARKKVDAPPVKKLVAAVSVGILNGQALVDLNYEVDKAVTVDFNMVATEDGEFVEVQGAGEEATFAQSELDQMLLLGRKGIGDLIAAQRAVLARIMISPPN